MSEFVVGGTVPLDSRAYVPRVFVERAVDLLGDRKWVLVLSPRQSGKSSALVRVAADLSTQGVSCVRIDFLQYGGSDDYPSLLHWFAWRLATDLNSELVEPVRDIERNDLATWLKLNLPAGDGLVAMLLDECGAVPEGCQHRFFGQLRSLYNAAANAPTGDTSRRVSVLFAGTFRPQTMVNGDNSPFNISVDLQVHDLSETEVRDLAEEIGGAECALHAQHVYSRVQGQPYLTQLFLEAMCASPDPSAAAKDVERRLANGEDRHFMSIVDKLTADENMQALASAVLHTAGGITLAPGDQDQQFIQVLGFARFEDGRIVVRNQLYAELAGANDRFSPAPAPAQDISPMSTIDSGLAKIRDVALRQDATESIRAARNSAGSGDYRMALAGLGAAMEACLKDYVLALPASVVKTARNAVDRSQSGSGKRRVPGPGSMSLDELISVTHETLPATSAPVNLAQDLRRWRNEIHPSTGIRRPAEELEPEYLTGLGILAGVMRELPSISTGGP
jgi:hypothetical protein